MGTLIATIVGLGGVLSLVSAFVAVRWQARASLRQDRQRRSDDAARSALDAVEKLEGVRRGGELAGTQEEGTGWDFEDGVTALRRSNILIANAALRNRLTFVGRALQEIDSTLEPGYEYQVRWGLVGFARDSIAAHLRGEGLPRESERVPEYRSVVDELTFLRDEAARAQLANEDQARRGERRSPGIRRPT